MVMSVNPWNYKLTLITKGHTPVAIFDKIGADRGADWVQLIKGKGGRYVATWISKNHRGSYILPEEIAKQFTLVMFPETL